MTPEREAELARQLGLDEAPKIRYEQAPDENLKLEQVVNFRKALMLVDPLRTAMFERFIPDRCVIDRSMDAYSLSQGPDAWSDARLLRTDVPPPVNPQNPTNLKVMKATGIPFRMDDEAFMIWLGIELGVMYDGYGARRMAPPIVFAGRGDKKVPGARPFIGIIGKFMRRQEEVPADWGAIVPAGTPIKAENKRLALAQVDKGSNLVGE